jgi:hypothetical protein
LRHVTTPGMGTCSATHRRLPRPTLPNPAP